MIYQRILLQETRQIYEEVKGHVQEKQLGTDGQGRLLWQPDKTRRVLNYYIINSQWSKTVSNCSADHDSYYRDWIFTD